MGFFEKLSRYTSTSLAISRWERLNPAVVFGRVAVAYLRYNMQISSVSYSRLARRPTREYEDYLVKKELIPVLMRLNSADGREVTNVKTMFHDACVERGVPTVPIWGLIATGEELEDSGIPRIRNGKDLESIADAHAGSLFLKPLEGILGRGLSRLRVVDGEAHLNDGTVCGTHELVERTLAAGEAYIVQPCLEAHEGLRALMPSGALGTVRMVTVLGDDGATIVAASVKLPRGSNLADNFKLGATGNLLAGIDHETGRLGPAVAAHPQNVLVPTLLDRHPDTGALINGFEFPGWSELCEVTRRAAEQFPELPTGGWDVAMTTTGPVVIETNWRYDIDLIQIANQRGVRPDLLPRLRRALRARGEGDGIGADAVHS